MVDHDSLTHHLTDIGVSGVAFKWLTTFLLGWGQRVALGERMSPWHPLVCRAPRGTVLSPMLFHIYMCPFTQLVWSFELGCHQ